MEFFVRFSLLLSIICFGSSIDILGHNIVCSSGTNQQNIIPNTSLKTNKFYTLRLKRFLNTGIITWTNQCHSSGARYLQSDNGASQQYEKDGKWEYDAQWVFIQSLVHPDWYELVNRGISGEYLSFDTNNRELKLSDNKFYALLNPNYHPKYTSSNFLWKPVLHRDVETGEEFYQLQSKAIPDAVVTWSEKKHLRNGQYIQIDNSRDVKYNKGNEWFDDTLFRFQPVDDVVRYSCLSFILVIIFMQYLIISSISIVPRIQIPNDHAFFRIKASIFKFKLDDKYPENLEGQIDEQVDLIPQNLKTFQNNDSISITQDHSAVRQISERILIEVPKYLENIDIVTVERFVELETQATIPFLASSFLKKSLVTALSNSSLNSENFVAETQKEFIASHEVAIPPCMEYKMSSTVKYVKNYPVDFIVQFKITGNEGGVKVGQSLLRAKYIPEGMEYLDTFDSNTVIAQGMVKMRVDFVDSTSTFVSVIGIPLQECSRKYECSTSIESANA